MNAGTFLFWSLGTLIALSPLPFGGNRPWAWALLGLGVGFLVVLWAVAAFRNAALAPIEWRRSRLIVVPFAVLVFWFLAQASGGMPEAWHHPLWREASGALNAPLAGAISLNPEASRQAVLRLLTYGGVFWLAFQLGRDEKRARNIFWIVAMAGLAYAIYGLVAHLGGSQKILWYPKWAYQDSLTSTFVNRNHYATYAGVTLLACLALLLAEIRRIRRHSPIAAEDTLGFFDACGFRFYFLIVACGILFTALLLSHSRGGFLSAAVGVGTFAVVAGMRLREQRRSIEVLPMAVGGMLALSLLAAILAVSGKEVFNRLGDAAKTDRLAIYERTLEGIGDRPFLGFGLDTFKESFRLYRDEGFRFYVDTIDHAHNTYLELAMGGGLPAFALLLFLAGYVTLLCFLGALRRRRNAIFPAAGVAVTALVGVHALADFSLQIPAVAITYLGLLGVASAQSWSAREEAVSPS